MAPTPGTCFPWTRLPGWPGPPARGHASGRDSLLDGAHLHVRHLCLEHLVACDDDHHKDEDEDSSRTGQARARLRGRASMPWNASLGAVKR